MNSRIENWIITFICFLASGYRIFLMIILYFGLGQYSRYYSIPIRILLVSLMIFFLIKKRIKIYYFNFCFFLVQHYLYTQNLLTEISGVYNLG